MTMSEDSDLTTDSPPAEAADAEVAVEGDHVEPTTDDSTDDEASGTTDSVADPEVEATEVGVDAPADDIDSGEATTDSTDSEAIDDIEPVAADEAVLAEDELLESDEPAPPPVQSPYDRAGRWFVVHTQSGYEKKVKQNLEARTASMNMEERILEVVIPMDDVVEFKGGKKVVVQKKMFPGYLLVRCHLDDDSWYVIRNTPGIVNFVGAGGKPSPLSRREVETFLHVEQPGVKESTSKVKARFAFDMGETVRVKEGPFADFSGEIVEINEDQAKVKVLVNIFGRETPVELEFSQVAKL